MIEIKSLSKFYGDKKVLEDVNLYIDEGCIFGLTGINGAGKTTLMRALAGVIKTENGEIIVDGERLDDKSKVRRKIVFLPDEPYSAKTITFAGLKKLYSVFYNIDKRKLSEYLEMFGLDETVGPANMSKGMRRQAFISIALSTDCKYFLFDEAFDGLDPIARLSFKRALIEKKEEGCTIILSSHSLRELEDIADGFALLNGRRVKSSGNVNDVLEGYVKLQIAFSSEKEKEDMPFPCAYFNRNGRIVTLIAKGEEETLIKKLEPLSPVLTDVLAVDLEEFFLSVANDGGDS